MVNTYTSGNQVNGGVAIDADGDFVVVWGSPHDGDNSGIFAARFSSDGLRQGIDFQVNVYTANAQQVPVVAIDNGRVPGQHPDRHLPAQPRDRGRGQR
jgi:hypothetical protein